MTQLQRFVRVVLLAGMLLLVGSCVTTTPPGSAQLRSIVHAMPGSDPPWQLADTARGVTVRRGGANVPVHVRMLLEPGDEITTDGGVAAVLRLGGDVGEAILDERTSVRLGSLEVFFGKVFANLRGVFTVRSETVEAVNDGTRYLFEVAPSRATRVTVVDGTITCQPRRGSWGAVRVGAQRALVVDYPGTSTPRFTPANPLEIASRYESIRGAQPAPTQGYCCRSGQVTQTMSNQCDGTFWPSRAGADQECRPAPPPPPRPPPPKQPGVIVR
jgi:hypothetical protein